MNKRDRERSTPGDDEPGDDERKLSQRRPHKAHVPHTRNPVGLAICPPIG